MIEKMIEMMLRFGEVTAVNAEKASIHYTETFNDPFAGKTDWNSIGESEYLLLRRKISGKVSFRPTILSHFPPGAFMLGGLFLTVIAPFLTLTEVREKSQLDLLEGLHEVFQSRLGELAIPFLCGLIFLIPSFVILRGMWRPVVFNIQKGYFYKGSLKAHEHPRNKDSIVWCSLEEIHALQILRHKDIESEGESTISYEVNIVKKDISRISVVRYNKLKKAQKEASTLAQVLSVPLWDGVTFAYKV